MGVGVGEANNHCDQCPHTKRFEVREKGTGWRGAGEGFGVGGGREEEQKDVGECAGGGGGVGWGGGR